MKIKYRILQFVFLLILVSGALIFITVRFSQESKVDVYNGVSGKLRELQELSILELENAKKVADEGILDASSLVTIDKVTFITLDNQKKYNEIVNKEIEKASRRIAETLESQQHAVNSGLDRFLGEATDAVSEVIKHGNISFGVLSNSAITNVDYLQNANRAGLTRFKELQNKYEKALTVLHNELNEDLDRLLIDIINNNDAASLSEKESRRLISLFDGLKVGVIEKQKAFYDSLFSDLDMQKSILAEETRIISRNVKWAITNEKKNSALSQSAHTNKIIASLLETQEEINTLTLASASNVRDTIENLKHELPVILQEKGRQTNEVIFSQIDAAKKDTARTQDLVGKRIEENTQKAMGVFESAIEQSYDVINSSLESYLTKTVRISLIIAVSCGVLALLLGYLMIKSISSPIAKVRDFAHRLARGNLEERLPEGNDEMGEMSRALNRMADELSLMQQATIDGFNQTLDQVIDCVFIFDPYDYRFNYINQGAIKHTGYERDELLEMTPLDIDPEFEEEDLEKLLAPLISGEKESAHFQSIHRTKDNKKIPVEVLLKYATPPRNSPRMVAIVRDISERVNQQQEKEKIQAELLQKQKLESVGQLAAGLSHEINTPTQFIGTNIEFLSDAFESICEFIDSLQKQAESWPEEARKSLAQALEDMDWEFLSEETPDALSQSRDGVDRVFTLVSAMKRFSHPGTREMSPANLNEIIDTALTVSRNEWKYVAEVHKDFGNSLEQVPLLADEFGQVILNIVVNAAHALKEKFGDEAAEIRGVISITTYREEDDALLVISDNGVGISKEHLDKVFNPFFTTKSVGKGTGQGLAICHDVIVKKHNGSLHVDSKEGEGATFTIRLPLKMADKKNSVA